MSTISIAGLGERAPGADVCPACGQWLAEPVAVADLEREQRKEFARQAIDLANELYGLGLHARGWRDLVERMESGDHVSIYNSVRYGMHVDRLLRCCSKLLHLVVELNSLQPPIGGESQR